MKLQLKGAHICGGGIGSPGKANILSATIETEFNPAIAGKLGCLEETYVVNGSKDRVEGLRKFSYHGLKLEVPEAVILLQAGSGKAQEFKGRVSELEILQKKLGFGLLRAKLSFAQQGKLEAFALLFGEIEGSPEYRVTIEGAQQEMFEEAEQEGEAEAE